MGILPDEYLTLYSASHRAFAKITGFRNFLARDYEKKRWGKWDLDFERTDRSNHGQ